jgi:hypothetical protein
MGAKNFVNQFKNTRRQTGLQGRRPLGGQTGLQSGKKDGNGASGMKKPVAGRRSWGKNSKTKP